MRKFFTLLPLAGLIACNNTSSVNSNGSTIAPADTATPFMNDTAYRRATDTVQKMLDTASTNIKMMSAAD